MLLLRLAAIALAPLLLALPAAAQDASGEDAPPQREPMIIGAATNFFVAYLFLGAPQVMIGEYEAEKALRLIANGEPLFGSAASFVDLSAGAGQSSRDRLVDFGEIVRVGPRWRVVDPLYADWIRRRFPM